MVSNNVFLLQDAGSRSEVKTSSLRSVRVKPDRRDNGTIKDRTSTKPATITSSIPDKNQTNVPVTTAVAPVVEKQIPEKSASPLEVKENVPEMQQADVGRTKTDAEDDVVEVPYKPKTPEIINLDDDDEEENSQSVICDVKKRKLDILKEGGLEVTAVSVNDKDRPSVIQPTLVPSATAAANANAFRHEIGNLSITLTPDTRKMPPPLHLQSAVKARQAVQAEKAELSIPRREQKIRIGPPPKSAFSNGSSPPKVVQSRSIYSYSERVVYGNPKDQFLNKPMNMAATITPAAPAPPQRTAGGEVLDLTIRSPQKPIVEIVRVPSVSSLSSRMPKSQPITPPAAKTNLIPNLPAIEGRLGSNLEITLVSAGAKPGHRQPQAPQPPSNRSAHPYHNNGTTLHKLPQKRASNGSLIGNRKMDVMENGRSPYEQLQRLKQSEAARISERLEQSRRSEHLSSVPNHYLFPPNYPRSSRSEAKPHSAPPPSSYPLPVLDPLYYSALCSQTLYPGGPLGAVPPLFPQAPTVEQFQFYKDLMAHTARTGRFPFMPHDGMLPVDNNKK